MHRKALLTSSIAAAVALAGGCAQDAPLLPPEGPPSLVTTASLPPPIVVEGDFRTPESAVHDAVADVYLVSNVNGHPQMLTNDGFISRVTPEGTIEELEWIRGGVSGVTLHAPTGLVLVGDVLYVADADAVHLFHRESGEPLGSWPVPVRIEPVPGMPGVDWVRGVLLNGLCSGPRGEIHLTATGIDINLEFDVTPTGEDVVYRFQNGTPVPIAEGGQLAGANGCWVVGANVHIAPLLAQEVYRLNPSGKQFGVATLPVDGLDGLVHARGHFYVSSVFHGQVIRMSTGGARVTTILEGLDSPADLGYDAVRHRLLIPSLFGDIFTIQPLQ